MILFPKSVSLSIVPQSICLSISPSLHPSISLPACLPVFLCQSLLPICLSTYLSVYLPICLPVCLSISLPTSLPACLPLSAWQPICPSPCSPACLSISCQLDTVCFSEVCCLLCPSVGPNKSIYNVNSVLRLTSDSTWTCNTRWWPPDIIVTLSDIDLKKAAKIFAQKYSCGSSVTGPDEIVIQGDVVDDLLEFIPEKWPEVQYSHTYKHLHMRKKGCK